VVSEAAVEFFTLSFGYGKRLWMLSDAIPHGFNELDTFLDAQAENLFKLVGLMLESLRRYPSGCNQYA
jgi:hypothetical protein